MNESTGPLVTGEAQRKIAWLSSHPMLTLITTNHARDQIRARSILMDDVLFALGHGAILTEPVKSTREGMWKYKVTSFTPNSDARRVAVVVIFETKTLMLKLVTVMWADEEETRAGTLIGDNNG